MLLVTYTATVPYADPVKQRAAWTRYYERRKAAGDPVPNSKPAGRLRNRMLVASAKTGPCTDCGQTFHPCQMDFDHTGQDKVADIAWLANQPVSVKRLRQEMAKCDLVCANCHRLRTWIRAHGGRTQMDEGPGCEPGC